jgi:TDG/mug DNA glycosylase family protein
MILILGTIPSRESIRRNEYYGNPRNQFWKLVFKSHEMDPFPDYEGRLSFLRERRIALWDVLKECEREGSSDSSIRLPRANEFNELLNCHEEISHIFFNGKRSEELFKRLVILDSNIEDRIIKSGLPSSSPANTMSFKEKLKVWRDIALNLHSAPSTRKIK